MTGVSALDECIPQVKQLFAMLKSMALVGELRNTDSDSAYADDNAVVMAIKYARIALPLSGEKQC